MSQLTIEQLAANGGYTIEGTKHRKGEKRLAVLSKDGRTVIVDDELISMICALGKPIKVPAEIGGPIKAVQ